MIILISSKITQSNIQASLGKAEYSYYFLLKEFMPAFERIGQVVHVSSESEVDSLYADYATQGHDVVFISVSPPHQVPLTLACPTVTLFAWEFDTLPSGGWDDNPSNDWRHVFAHTQGAISTSCEAASLVQQAMGDALPVIALPAPVWDRFSVLSLPTGLAINLASRKFEFAGVLIDSLTLGLSADGLVRKPEPVEAVNAAEIDAPQPEPAPAPLSTFAYSIQHSAALMRGWWAEVRQSSAAVNSNDSPVTTETLVIEPEEPSVPHLHELVISGVVYSTVLNPADSRKNWVEIVTAFCWAFKGTEDATLIIKMTHHDLEYYRIVLITLLSRLAPFKCRVLVLHGFLDDVQYREMIAATSFYVNASSGEGLCLPLMEFLSAGKPSIAPVHTAMADYVDSSLAFIVECSLEPFCWPHDPTGIFTTHRHRLNWQSLMEAYQNSYKMAKTDAPAYQRMSMNAYAKMKSFASVEQVAVPLKSYLSGVIDTAVLAAHAQSLQGAEQ